MKNLYLTYASEVWEEYQLNLNKFITLSSLAFYVLRCTLKTKIKLLPFETDLWVRRSIYGGRCFPQSRYYVSPDHGKAHADIKRYLVDLDAVSLYPSSMKKKLKYFDFKNYYTDGEYREYMGNDDEERAKMDKWMRLFNAGVQMKLCIAEVDLEENTDLISPPVPHKDAKGHTKWSFTKESCRNQVYNSVDLCRMIKYGYKIKHIHRLLIFNKGNVDLFSSFIDENFKAKCDQPKTSSKYKLRKMLLNCPWGRLIMRVMHALTSNSRIHTCLKNRFLPPLFS